MPNALFRCDAGPGIGIGHLMRCRALAEALSNRGWRNWFAVTADTTKMRSDRDFIVVPEGPDGSTAVANLTHQKEIDCLVVDQYGLDREFEHAAHGAASVTIVIDDLANRRHACDILIDVNPLRTASDYAAFTDSGTHLLLGPEFALLRSEFAERRSLHSIHGSRGADRLLITFGGADPENISERALSALTHLRHKFEETVLIVGPANPHLNSVRALAARLGVRVEVDPPEISRLMAQSDLAVTAGGASCWELACLGIPMLIVVAADNQRSVANALEAAGAAAGLGEAADLNERSLATTIDSVAADRELRFSMTKAGRKLVDGRGTSRVADAIMERLRIKQQRET